MADYSKMTNDEFQKILITILNEHRARVYEVLATYFNNKVLDLWALGMNPQEHEEDEDEEETTP